MGRILKCQKCGATVQEIVPCNCAGCGISCCGEPMTEVKESK